MHVVEPLAAPLSARAPEIAEWITDMSWASPDSERLPFALA
jgi:hypothetical protein